MTTGSSKRGDGRSCARSNCFAPDTPCNLGSELRQCRFFVGGHANDDAGEKTGKLDPVERKETQDIDKDPNAESAATVSLPWSANSLGSVDLEFVAARSKPWLIGLVGNQNAGKTTLLTVLYLLLHQGRAPDGRQFAGSFTLGGWEALAHHLRWAGGQAPSFPPHTPRSMRRVPGLLHLAFRSALVRSDSQLEDVLLTDPPGEWFGAWAVDANSSSAEGARWIGVQSDAFAFFVDSEALAGPERGNAREQLLRLTQRLNPFAKGKRVAVIWTKSDIDVRDSIRRTVSDAFDRYLPGARTYSIQVPLAAAPSTAGASAKSADSSAAILELLTWLMNPLNTSRGSDSPVQRADEPISDDPFFAYSRVP